MTLAQHPNFIDLLQFALSGLAIVLTTLCSLAIFCYGLSWCIRHVESLRTPAPPVKEATAEEDSELIAVIRAAVAHVTDQPHRIVHLRVQEGEQQQWYQDGRAQHHHSHTPKE